MISTINWEMCLCVYWIDKAGVVVKEHRATLKSYFFDYLFFSNGFLFCNPLNVLFMVFRMIVVFFFL